MTLEVECIDRMYLNGYVDKRATGVRLRMFLNQHLKKPYASPALRGQITQDFVQRLKKYADDRGIPVIRFKMVNQRTISPMSFAASGGYGMKSCSSG